MSDDKLIADLLQQANKSMTELIELLKFIAGEINKKQKPWDAKLDPLNTYWDILYLPSFLTEAGSFFIVEKLFQLGVKYIEMYEKARIREYTNHQ